MGSAFNFRHLQALAAVAHCGGVRRAATEINLSQPAISQAVLKLEDDIGDPLFDRTASGMFATPACEIFLRRIDRAIGYLKLGAQELAPRKLARSADRPLLERLATTVQLRALVEVIEHGGYAPAARRLGVTQPNISRAIRDLEKIAGRKLFQPSPSGARPTPEALGLARWSSLAFREIEQGLDELRELKGTQDGSIIVGTLPLARTLIVPTAVTRLLCARPDAKVKIIDGSYAELLNRLRSGQIDLILGALRFPAPSNDIRQEELFIEPLSIVVRADHPLLKAGALTPEKLVDLEWVVPNPLTPARSHFTSFFKKHRLAVPQRIIECSSLVATRGLLLQSDRAALLSASQIHYESQAGDLTVAELALPGTERPIGICTRLDWAPTKTQSAFLSEVRAVVSELSAEMQSN